MRSLSDSFLLILLQFLLLHLPPLVFAFTVRTRTGSIPALFVFGDSTVDSGNNNYRRTIARSNFRPYGKDFLNHTPTGRFTNGKLVTDFMVSYLRIKEYVPPYLNRKLSLNELKTGVCFASAASGYDPLTTRLQPGVISMERQLVYFKEYTLRMENYIGKARTETLISESVFLVSSGANDFILNYYGPNPIRRKTYNIPAYQELVLQHVEQFVQDLIMLGARKIAFVGLPPIGCVPAMITRYSKKTARQCVAQLSSVAWDYNRMVRNKLASMQTSDVKIVYFDIYNPIVDMVTNAEKYGFVNVRTGCCGTGLIEIAVLCNRFSKVCADDSKYLFFDAVHPTEVGYYKVFQTLLPAVDQFLMDYISSLVLQHMKQD